MSDYTWTIGGITTDGKIGPQSPTWTWGEETPVRFWFQAGSAPGGKDASTRFQDLQAYVRGADLSTTQVYDTQARPRFEQRVPGASPVSSLVVAVEPGSGVQGVDSVWALLVGGRDLSRPVTGNYSLEVVVVPLAPLADYATASDVEAALGSGVL